MDVKRIWTFGPHAFASHILDLPPMNKLHNINKHRRGTMIKISEMHNNNNNKYNNNNNNNNNNNRMTKNKQGLFSGNASGLRHFTGNESSVHDARLFGLVRQRSLPRHRPSRTYESVHDGKRDPVGRSLPGICHGTTSFSLHVYVASRSRTQRL